VDRRSWSWVNPPDLKNETELIPELIDIVSKNGNLLLDIPPHADGSIDPVIQNTLFAIGEWLEVNGQAIFATKPWWNGTYGEGPTQITTGSFHEWPIFTAEDFRFTTKDKVLFATALAWSDDGSFHIKSINTTALERLGKKISSVALVGASDQKVDFSLQSDGLHITSLKKPASVQHAFVFRIHLDSNLGFVAWDRPRLEDQPAIRPGRNNTLRWLSGADAMDTAEDIKLERWVSAEGRWKSLSSALLPNTGVFIWDAPSALETPLLLRIQAALYMHYCTSCTRRGSSVFHSTALSTVILFSLLCHLAADTSVSSSHNHFHRHYFGGKSPGQPAPVIVPVRFLTLNVTSTPALKDRCHSPPFASVYAASSRGSPSGRSNCGIQ
jgi:hypothetical protein